MPRPGQLDSFLLLIVDRDKKLFNIVGPMKDDTEWNRRVSDAQKNGRDVRIDGPLHMVLTRDEFVAETRKRLRVEYSEVDLV